MAGLPLRFPYSHLEKCKQKLKCKCKPKTKSPEQSRSACRCRYIIGQDARWPHSQDGCATTVMIAAR